MGCNSSKNSFLLESQDLLASKVLSETQDRSDSESLEATSLDFKGCPHAHFSVTSAETKKYNLSDNDKTERKASPKNPAKIFLSFLIQTIFLLFLLGGLSFGLYKLVLSFDVKLHRLQEKLKTPPTPEDSIPKFFDFTKRFLTPAEWWDSNEADWDHRLWLTRGVVAFTSLCFAMDLLFSSPEEEGKWLMMLPALSLSIAYTLMSIYSEASDTFDPGMFWWKSIVLMGEQLFNRGEVVVLTFTDLSVLHLACSFAFLKDFYSRITSRRVGYRLLMIPLTLLTPLYGIASVPVYLLFRLTLFVGPEVWAPERLPMNRSRQLREFGYLYDPIPKRGPGLTGWISQIPSPFCFVFFALQVASGCILSMLTSIGYSFYVVFICLPVAALFFSLRRSFLRMVEMKTQGAVFGPFETLRSEGRLSHVPKAIVVVSGHLRLICLKQKENPVFNILIGWWLRKFLEFSVTFEFPATFHKVEGVPSYVDFLMEEFGPVFPFGQGLGFGKHKDVKAIIENPNHRKPTVSMITTMSEAQQSWSNKTTTELPTTEHEKAIVEEGRLLVHEWLKGINEKLKKQETKSRLDYILPKKNEDGTVLGEKRVKSSFGSTLFHLLTNGSLTRKEKKAYCALVEADRRLASDLINKVAGGGLLYRQSIQKYDLLRKAFLRYLNASSLQRSLALADKWDAWTSPEVVRFLTSVFAGNGNSAPAQLLWAIVEGLYQDETLVKEYQRDKRKFILEFARLERGVPMTYFMAHEFDLDGKKTVSIFNEEIEVSNGTRLHCSIMNANRDEEVFGDDASELNFDRPRATLGQMLTFNGNLNAMTGDIEQQCRNSPPRDCPGFGITLDILEYLIDRFCPSTDRVKDLEKMMNTTKAVRLDSIRDHVSYTSYASDLFYVIVELRKFVCRHCKELREKKNGFKEIELVFGDKDQILFESLRVRTRDIKRFLGINKDIMRYNEKTGRCFLLKEDDPIKDKPRGSLDVLEEKLAKWAKERDEDEFKDPEKMMNTTKNVRLDSIRDYDSFNSYASDLIYVIVELRKFVCRHCKELHEKLNNSEYVVSFKELELVFGDKDQILFESLRIRTRDIKRFLGINKDIMRYNEKTGSCFLLKEDDSIKDRPRGALDVLEGKLARWAKDRDEDKFKDPGKMKNTTKNERLDSIRDHVSYTSYASELIYVIVELRKFVCHHSKELSFKVPELILGAKDHKEYHSLDITPADIATFLEINKDIMGFNEITGIFFLLKEDDPIKDKPRRPLDVLEEDFNEWAKCKVKLVVIDDENRKTQPVYAIGINDMHQRVTLIFRGSVFGNKDWPTNLNLLPARTCDLFAKSKYIDEDDTKEMENAKFHMGFAQYLFRDLKPEDKSTHKCKFDQIVDNLKKVAYGEANRQGYKLIISGHSLGGALTQLFAFALGSSKKCRSFVPTPVSAITYASPSIGNIEYGQSMQKLEHKRIVKHLRITNEGDIVPVFLQSFLGLGYTQTGCNLHVIPNQTGKLDGLGNTGSLRSQIGLDAYRRHSMDSYTDSLHARDEDEDVDLNSEILMRDLDYAYFHLSRGTVKDSRFYLAPDVYESWTVGELHDALDSRNLGFDLETEMEKAKRRGSDPLMGMDLAQGVVFDAITKLKEDDARTMSYAKQFVFPRLSSKELL